MSIDRALQSLATFFALMALLLVPHTVMADDPGKEADEHFIKGKTLLKQGKKREAREEYLAAFKLKQSFDVAGNLGNIELGLGMPRDAAEHLSFAVRHYAPSGTTPEQLERAKQRLAEAKASVGTIWITVNVAGAEVLVDGSSVGRAPLEGEVFVDPGKRTFEAKLAGHRGEGKTLDVGKGSEHKVVLDLAQVTAPTPTVVAPPPSAPPTATPHAPGGPNKAVLIAGGSAAGAGILIGAVLAGVSAVKAGDARAQRDDLIQRYGPSACTGMTPAGCGELHETNTMKDALANASLWSFVAGGSVGVATLIYALAAPRKATSAAVRMTPLVTASGATLTVGGTW